MVYILQLKHISFGTATFQVVNDQRWPVATVLASIVLEVVWVGLAFSSPAVCLFLYLVGWLVGLVFARQIQILWACSILCKIGPASLECSTDLTSFS